MNVLKYIFFIALVALFACEENELLPDHQVLGDAYATYVELAVSDDAPAAGSTINIALDYSNYASDPIKTIRIMHEYDGIDVTQVETMDESNAPVGQLVEKVIPYTVPAVASGTTISIYVELYSDKKYPQVESTSITVP